MNNPYPIKCETRKVLTRNENSLETQHLSHIFPDGTIGIQDINISFDEGEFLILAGTNGSGKTVLVRHFNGLLLPTEGQVLFEGDPSLATSLAYTRKNIGLIFQDPTTRLSDRP